jgi:hypothetical protein
MDTAKGIHTRCMACGIDGIGVRETEMHRPTIIIDVTVRRRALDCEGIEAGI